MFKDHSDDKPTVREGAAEKKAETKTIEAWNEVKNPGAFKYASAKAHARWVDYQEVTESEFDKAVADAAGTVQR